MNPHRAIQNHTHGDRPFVFLNVASTADGKIAPANRKFDPFGSKTDQHFLHVLRARADAVMAGARTIDSADVTMGPGGRNYRELRLRNKLTEYNLRVVVSGSGTLNPRAKIFEQKFSPVIVLVSNRATPKKIDRLRKLGAIVHVSGSESIDFPRALRWLHEKWNVRWLLCEGGGELNDALFRAHLVDEVYLTLCPRILGGHKAPTMADGSGSLSLEDSTPLKFKSAERIGDELFLRYAVRRG